MRYVEDIDFSDSESIPVFQCEVIWQRLRKAENAVNN